MMFVGAHIGRQSKEEKAEANIGLRKDVIEDPPEAAGPSTSGPAGESDDKFCMTSPPSSNR